LTERIGEVIEARTVGFLAECYELHTAPPLGSLVRTSDGEVDIFGVVCSATTEGIDPGRRPVARGQGESNEEDVYRQNPQLSKLLRTSFDSLVIGHSQDDTIRHYLPPRPPRVHGFVYQCEESEVRRFTGTLGFLTALLDARSPSGDEVVAACLRQASGAHDDQRGFLVSAGKELAVLLSGDLYRLNAILRRIRR
jgi:hypothetical protein